MKKLLVLALVAVMASGAMAQELGLFFGAPYTEETTNNTVVGFTPVPMYLVLLNGPIDGIRGFEAGMKMNAGQFMPGTWVWENGFTQLGGTIYNFQVLGPGGAVIPYAEGGSLLGIYTTYYNGTPGTIELGPYSPPGIPCHPVLVDITGTQMIPCDLVINSEDIVECWGVVATVLLDGVIATEETTLSNVKALFQ